MSEVATQEETLSFNNYIQIEEQEPYPAEDVVRLDSEGQEHTYPIQMNHFCIGYDASKIRAREHELDRVDFMAQYNPHWHVFSDERITSPDDWIKAMEDPDTHVTLLCAGLSSNWTEWASIIPGQEDDFQRQSFIQKLRAEYQRWDENRYNRNLKHIIICIDSPGFGETHIQNDVSISPLNVGSGSYARLFNAALHYLSIPTERSTAAGHSHGAEMLLEWYFNYARRTVTRQQRFAGYLPNMMTLSLFNPSVGIQRQRIFAFFKSLADFGTSAEKLTDKISKIARLNLVSKGAKKMIEAIEDLTTKYSLSLLGRPLSPREALQIETHLDEMREHSLPFSFTLGDLSDRQTWSIPENQDPEHLRNDIYLIAAPTTDALTKVGPISDFFREVIQTTPAETPTFDIAEVLSGHDAIFHDQEAQEAAIKAIMIQMSKQVAPRK